MENKADQAELQELGDKVKENEVKYTKVSSKLDIELINQLNILKKEFGEQFAHSDDL